ncbi:hypothetical protein ACQY1Q_16360 [Tenacibaculum sp. TC6]|uniref:hypothetical protein n=1 Tax=Tenacibaculum sp. TC6 TaxID=3423223 RepID=UPI003D362576
MNDLRRMIYCQQCMHMKVDASDDVLCGLTNARPDFEEECDTFAVNPEIMKESRAEKSYSMMKLDFKTVASIIIFIVALIRLIRRFIK